MAKIENERRCSLTKGSVNHEPDRAASSSPRINQGSDLLLFKSMIIRVSEIIRDGLQSLLLLEI